MAPLIVVLVLAAALLHAAWNSLVKMSGDTVSVAALIVVGCGVLAAPTLFVVARPAPEAWPMLAASAVLHLGYVVFLGKAYQHGDLSQVYPIARGSAPVLLALLAFAVLGEALSSITIAAIAVISTGVISLTLRRRQAHNDGRPVLFALGTAVFIASYTLVDGYGARVAGSPHAYAAWSFVVSGAVIFVAVLAYRRRRFLDHAVSIWPRALAGSAMALVAYWIVIWALAQGPMAPVAALRETSVIFAALFGAVLLREPFGRLRFAAAALVAAGVVLLQV
ncbi:MAG: EamA family transporter [Proteobacteria bacterium]|nr:EamA family transporter [Pseudomonadota bacterium]